jgi:hypothetical protein
MNWIKSNEREPSTEGKYHCKYNGVKVVLNFVKIQPNREHFVMNENYNDDLLKETKFWTEDVNSSMVIKPHGDLVWLNEN